MLSLTTGILLADDTVCSFQHASLPYSCHRNDGTCRQNSAATLATAPRALHSALFAPLEHGTDLLYSCSTSPVVVVAY
jgi:hypothetical protein